MPIPHASFHLPICLPRLSHKSVGLLYYYFCKWQILLVWMVSVRFSAKISRDVGTMKNAERSSSQFFCHEGRRGSLEGPPSLETQGDPEPLKVSIPPLSILSPSMREQCRDHHSRSTHKIKDSPKHTKPIQFLALTVALGEKYWV